MYGMSRDAHRDKMPNHLLQWAAIRWAVTQGCETYDFWGAPDEFVESDPLWGVWKFKEGLRRAGGAPPGRLGLCARRRCCTGCTPPAATPADVLRRRGQRATQAALEP